MKDPDKKRGLYGKFFVHRMKPHSRDVTEDCEFFVLDYAHDPYAINAMRTYAVACQTEYPHLAVDLFEIVREFENKTNGIEEPERCSVHGNLWWKEPWKPTGFHEMSKLGLRYCGYYSLNAQELVECPQPGEEDDH